MIPAVVSTAPGVGRGLADVLKSRVHVDAYRHQRLVLG